MTRIGATALFLALAILGHVRDLSGQEFQIGIIDFYGLRRVSAGDARRALTFKEGAAISLNGDNLPAYLAESERRLSMLPGVERARTDVVCCDSGRVIVYVGIEEQGAPTLRLRRAPTGAVRLPADLVQAGEELSKAVMLAVQRGDAEEDRTQGHSLMHDPTSRAIQQRFIVLAKRDFALLRLVLRNSSDAAQRALAAYVLGYAANKPSVVDDLVRGMSDPVAEVRNNAMRTLLVFAEAVPRPNGSSPRIPVGPFIEFLNSPVWSDRNKASSALMALSARRDERVLAEVRTSARTSLVEMARWKSAGHAQPAFMILGRIAGFPDETLQEAWDRGDRESVISAALNRR